MKSYIISKGKRAKMGPVKTMDITLGHIWECFFPKKQNKYSYLGYAYIINPEKEVELIDFFKAMDKMCRPFLCPKFVLRLLKLFGDDNSIVRMRNVWLSKVYSYLLPSRIYDTKWKYDTYRIYGRFSPELRKIAEETARKITLKKK